MTLLTDFEPTSDPHDWRIGEHGLRLSFDASGRRYSATFLPEVAAEQGWSQDETLQSLVTKSGWRGANGSGSSSGTDWRRIPGLRLTRYRGKKYGASYEEYARWKTWVGAGGGKA